jgi:hypothetical protein
MLVLVMPMLMLMLVCSAPAVMVLVLVMCSVPGALMVCVTGLLDVNVAPVESSNKQHSCTV